MTTTFYYTKDTQRGTESLVVAGRVVRTVPSSHPSFFKIRDYCFDADRTGSEIDMDHILHLYDAENYINGELLRITDRVSFKDGKLLWDGEPAEGALANHIVRMVRARDDNYVAFALFMENLAQNPSEASRAALFEWIADRDFTITEEGHFIAYKGVSNAYKSLHQGYGIVNGEEQNGFLDNTVGNVVEVPRNRVNADRSSTCSYGLHVGTSQYANTYGVRRVMVSVNPRDVVMVPNDANGQKMRVCRYVVISDNDDKPLNSTTYTGEHRADEVEDDFYSDKCDECDCLLEDDGSCPCECGVDEADEEEVTLCPECGAETDESEPVCEDCLDDEEEKENFCEDCGDLVDDDFYTCAYCQDVRDEGEETDEGELDLPDRPTASSERPTPHGVCPFDGAALNADGSCSKYRSGGGLSFL